MKRSFGFSIIIMLVFSICYVPGGMAADVPKTLNYQGDLTDNTGQPVSGTKSIKFSLYDVLSGGTAQWTETQTVTVTNGHFSVVLGNSTPLTTNLFTGESYLGIKVGTDAEMAPRQKLTSVAYAFVAANAIAAVPQGGIIMWSGAVANIPEGWALCDGVERTLPDGSKITPPNLKDRFVVGAGNIYAVNAKNDGSTTRNLSHVHTTVNHTLTVNEMPSHTHIQDQHRHTYDVADDTVGEGYPGGGNSQNKEGHNSAYATATNQNTGGGAAHNHGNTGSGGSATQDIMPPYYALCFIMKL